MFDDFDLSALLVFNVSVLFDDGGPGSLPGIPTFVMPRAVLMSGWRRLGGRWNIWLMRVICGTSVRILGTGKNSKRPADRCLEAPVDVGDLRAALVSIDQPVFILKRELTWIPFFGWYLLKKAGMIGGRARRPAYARC